MDYAADPSKLAPDDLAALQRELAAAGFYGGKVDGSYGPRTAAAWRSALAYHLTGPVIASTALDGDKRTEFARLWPLATILPERRAQVEADAHQILAHRDRYEGVGSSTGVPWFVVGLIHLRECGGRFDQHLHNGDSLNARTVHVPAGRPARGNPPFTWAYSAADALVYDRFTDWQDWTVAGVLHKLEGYNGFGPRRHGRVTGYNFAGTAVYAGGKYVADGVWDGTYQDQQSGCAAILRVLVEQDAVSF